MTDHNERAVARRVPSLVDRSLDVLVRREPIVVRPGTSLADCLAAIQGSGVADSVVVADEAGRLLGVLTERDIFGRLTVDGIDLSAPVETAMTTEVNRLQRSSSVRDAMALMSTGRYRNIPLVDGDRVVGIVRPQDVLRYLAEAFPEELLNLPPRPHQRMQHPEGA